MDAIEKCSACGAPMPKGFDRTCLRCGWDNQVGMRKCIQCKDGVVVLHEAIGYGPISGMVGIGWFVFWRLFGLLLGGMLICAIGSFCGLITAVLMRYKCSGCGKSVVGKILSKDERNTLSKRRLGYVIGGAVFGAGAIALLFAYVAFMNARYS